MSSESSSTAVSNRNATDLAAELVSYVPAFVRNRLASAREAPQQSWSESVEGVLLFADISGFTKLANRLAKHGPDGAEQLNQMLNRFYGRLVDGIYNDGGDVAAFAGDAAIAVWNVGDNDPAELTLSVCGTALRLQAELHNFDAGDGVRLKMKATLGAGKLLRGYLGSAKRGWQPFVGGEIFEQIRQCGEYAEPGEVVVSAPIAAAVEGYGRQTFLPGGLARLNRVKQVTPPSPVTTSSFETISANVLKSFAQRTVTTRLEAGQGDWMADLRNLTVVFVSLPGVKVQTTADLGPLNQMVDAIQVSLERWSGGLIHFIQDDKGLIAVIGFGLPPSLHDDYPDRAVSAALEMQRSLQQLGVSPQIGVATGRIFSGVRGNATRREYSLTGRIANLAARLMASDQAALMCDAATARALRRTSCQPVSELSLKGFDEPIPTFRLTSQDASEHRHQRVEGRAAERRRIGVWLDQVAEGRHSQLVIAGDAGVGKSTLVAELEALSAERGVRIVRADCNAIQQTAPYFAWRRMLRQLVGLGQDDEEAELTDGPNNSAARGERVLAALAGDESLVVQAALLNDLLELSLPQRDELAQLSSRARADSLQRLVLEIVRQTTSKSPHLLLIEDAHWLDSASWRLLGALAPRGFASLALTNRPFKSDPPKEYDTLFTSEQSIGIHLDRFTDTELRQLILSQLAPPDDSKVGVGQTGADQPTVGERLFQLVIDRTNGNPLHVSQLLEFLRTKRLVSISGGECELIGAAGNQSIVPDSVRALITAKVDGLSLDHQLTLKTASVVGMRFATQTLVAVCETPEAYHRVPRHLDSIDEADLIELAAKRPETQYQFQHATIQEVTYDQIPASNRKRVHRAVAGWLETQGKAAANSGLLAFHWGRAGNQLKEIDYLELAGEEAFEAYANREAIASLQQALAEHQSALPKPTDEQVRRRAHWLRLLSEAQFRAGDLEACDRSIDQALNLMRQPQPQSLPGLVLSVVRHIAVQAMHRIAPGWFLAKRVVPAEEESAGGGHEAALAVYTIGRLSYLQVDLPRGLHAALWVLNLSERQGKSRVLALSYAGVSLVAGVLGKYRLARVYANLAEQTAREVGNQPTLSHLLMTLSVTFLGAGDWDQTDQWLTDSIDLAERVGDQTYLYEALSVQGVRRCLIADYHGAAESFNRIKSLFDNTRNEVHLAVAFSGLGECYLRHGRLTEARTAAKEAYQTLREGLYSSERTRVLAIGSLACWRLGDADQAKKYFELAVTELDEQNFSTVSMLETLACLTTVSIAQQLENFADEDQTRRCLRKLRQYAKKFPIGWSRYHVLEGRAAAANDQPSRAARRLRRGLRLAESYKLPLEEALARLYLAEVTEGRHRDQHLQEALAKLDQLGVTHEGGLARTALKDSAKQPLI